MNLKEIMAMEEKVKAAIEELKADIKKETLKVKQPGIKKISDICCTIKFSNLQNNVWSPEYYNQSRQAEYIGKALESVTTLTAFTKKLNDIVEAREVKIGSNRYPINDSTIKIIKKYI